MTGSQRRYGGSRLRDERTTRGRAIATENSEEVSEGTRARTREEREREDYDSAALLRGRRCGHSGVGRGAIAPEEQGGDVAGRGLRLEKRNGEAASLKMRGAKEKIAEGRWQKEETKDDRV